MLGCRGWKKISRLGMPLRRNFRKGAGHSSPNAKFGFVQSVSISDTRRTAKGIGSCDQSSFSRRSTRKSFGLFLLRAAAAANGFVTVLFSRASPPLLCFLKYDCWMGSGFCGRAARCQKKNFLKWRGVFPRWFPKTKSLLMEGFLGGPKPTVFPLYGGMIRSQAPPRPQAAHTRRFDIWGGCGIYFHLIPY